MLLGPLTETLATRDTATGTRARLLLAAMELFAEHGVEGTSLRRINEVAECRNSSAVHYHFGGRDNLIGAVLAFIGARWDADLTAARQYASTEALLRIIGRSLLKLRNSVPWGYSALRFMQRLITERDPKLQALWRIHFGKHLEPLAGALGKINPDLPPDIIRLRLILTVVAMVNGIAGLDAFYRTALGDVRQARTEDQMLDELVAFTAAGLLAPEAVAA